MKRRLIGLCMALAALANVNAQTQEELWIKNGERNIYGVLSRPENGAKKQPVAIISHGFNGTHHFGKDYFAMLAEKGYQCYTHDFPGGSMNSRSDSNTMNMSVKNEVDDLLAVVRYFKNRPDVDSKRIVLIGESQGGLVSALAASSKAKDISQLVLIYPALCIPDNWNERYPDVAAIPDTTRMWNVPLSRNFFMELRDMDPYRELPKYKKPVLIIHGDADPVVPISYSHRAVDAYKKVRLEVIEKAGHGFKPQERNKAIEWIREFLK